MIDRTHAHAQVRAWIADWNRHDLDAVLTHYADVLEFVSPLVTQRLARPDGTIRSKATPKDYHFSLIVSERWYNSILDGMRRPRY